MFPTEDPPELGPELICRGTPIPSDAVEDMLSVSGQGCSANELLLKNDGDFVSVLPVGVTLTGGKNLEVTSVENAMFLHRDSQEVMTRGFLLLEKFHKRGSPLPQNWWDELDEALKSRNAIRRKKLESDRKLLQSKIDEINEELDLI